MRQRRGESSAAQLSRRAARQRSAPLLVLALALASACSAEGRGRARGSDAVPVKVDAVARKSMPVDLAAVGTLEAYSTVAVTAQVTGIIEAVLFKEGQEVAAGALLARLDARPYQAALAEAEARLLGNRSLAEKGEADLRRYTALADKEYASKEQLDQVRANVEALRATLKGNEAAIATARLNVAYCTIRAPLAGRTGALLIHAGNVVGPGPQQPLVVIVQTRPIRVAFALSEKFLGELREQNAAGPLPVVVRAADDSKPAEGQLDFIDNRVDHATGMIRVKAVFANADSALWPGQFVGVTLGLRQQPDALVVPSAAVQTGQQGSYVFVVKADTTVELRAVTVDRLVGRDTVLASGVEVGESVVTDGHLRLVPGGKVTVVGARAAPLAPSAAKVEGGDAGAPAP